MDEFRNFDLVSDDSDHHFRARSSEDNITNDTKKSIMKEWKILEQNLPESIYIHVYERRIDLMRAAIIGAAGTPYHDGLFFFDIVFPSNYPSSPPKVHFISFGLQLCPHLYPNGQVCLSLLNNVKHVKKSLKWDPCVSTCLQLLLSLQALVLKEKPYFGFPFSRAMNESVNRHTCKLILNLLKRPLKNFETFVKGHFRDRAVVILTAFIEYASGRASIKYSNVNNKSISRSYQKWAQEFYPSMINAFELCGASLDTFERNKVFISKSTILMKVATQIKKGFNVEEEGKKLVGLI